MTISIFTKGWSGPVQGTGIYTKGWVTQPLVALAPIGAQETLTHTPAFVLKQFLIDALPDLFSSPSADQDWPLFISHMPDTDKIPHDIGTIYDTMGKKDGRLMAGANILHYGIMIKIRATNYIEGWQKADDVAKELSVLNDELITVETTDYTIYNVMQASQVMAMGQEPGTKRRELFSINFLITLRET